MSGQNPINYSKTQRIVLLIDLNPLLHLQNPNSYLTSTLISAKKILSFPQIALSLSSFKLFFSSLSPLLSSSTLLKFPIGSHSPNSLTFNHPNETLISLSNTLHGFFNLGGFTHLGFGSASVSRGCFVSSSMAQVIHDYGWDLCSSEFNEIVRSNLVVLLSPVCRSFRFLCDFMGGVGDHVMESCHLFRDKFRLVFEHVRDVYVSRDIHFSWVDVRFDEESCDFEEYGRVVGMFRSGLKGLGWGFSSSDSIVLGSGLVPFGLIYPMIGVLSIYSDLSDTCKKFVGQLSLEILDVSGKPLECKYCDVGLFDLKRLRVPRINELSHAWEDGEESAEFSHRSGGFWEHVSNGLAKIDVKGLCRHDEGLKFEGHFDDVALVHDLCVDHKKNKEESSKEFFADRVIDLISNETSKFTKRRSSPLWQILLSFLYRRGYWGLVSLTNADGSTYMGVLKPFTVHTAFLCVAKKDIDSPCVSEFGLKEENVVQLKPETGDSIGCLDTEMDSANGMIRGESKRKHKKHPPRYKDLSWSSFCKAAKEECYMELEEAYLSKGCDTSKKLKFLKCWMKQVVKNGSSLSSKPSVSKIHSLDRKKTDERPRQLHQESHQSLPFLSGENAGMETPREPTVSVLEAIEAFFSNLSERIQHGIETGVDLPALAQRVVCSCIYWLSQKLGENTNEERHVSLRKSDCSSSWVQVARELVKILLKDPKALSGKHPDNDMSNEACDTKLPKFSSEDKVREYELQIMFRMEILQSKVAVGIGESTKNKFVKQICSLLEFIQCNMQDGFFGDFNLIDYVGRTIRSRYSQSLASVVRRIYEQMDLLLFDDEDESPNPLLNSEESSQSWKIGDNDRGSEPNSTEDSFCGPLKYNEQSQEEKEIADHDRKLVEAQERRKRASRFASFTRRPMPELQRVWAPKPPKLSRSKSESFSRCKRKNRHKNNDMVCESPMSATKKCLFPSEDRVDDQGSRDLAGSSSSSAYKTMFQEESSHHNWSP